MEYRPRKIIRKKRGGNPAYFALSYDQWIEVITKRDLDIMRWINRHGFAGAGQVSIGFSMNQYTVYSRLRKLLVGGLLKYEKIIHGLPGVYWLTRAGVKACESPLSPIKAPVLGKFEHDLYLIGLSLQLENQYADINWITAREVLSERVQGIRERSEALRMMSVQLPDGLLVRKKQRFAVELELSVKGDARIKKIITNYTREIIAGNYAAVFYYCGSDAIRNRVLELMAETTVANRFQVFLHKSQMAVGR